MRAYVSLNPPPIAWSNLRKLGRPPAPALEKARQAQNAWAEQSVAGRAAPMRKLAELLRARSVDYGALMTLEMGKVYREARAEVEKCALACDYYADHAGAFLDAEAIETDAGRSYVAYPPLGTVLGIMPWNFPFWQVFRFAAPALMAGNACALKHASNVPQCALAMEQVVRDAGFPEHLFTTLLIEASDVVDAIASRHIHAVTLTGSEPAGRKVAALAGQHLKKCVLELGGSDAFVVLEDADLELAAAQAVHSRYQNCGQSCIAAKRFILTPGIAGEFLDRFRQKVAALEVGDPMQEKTDLGPMARLDLRDELHRQVTDSLAQGAKALMGCEPLARDGATMLPPSWIRSAPAPGPITRSCSGRWPSSSTPGTSRTLSPLPTTPTSGSAPASGAAT